MIRICIIGTANIKHISLISLYTRFFDEKKIPYDIIYMDRYGIEEKTTANNQYCYKAESVRGKYQKIKAFIGFRKYANSIIAKNKYDLVITWQTTSAYLFADVLLRKYKDKYIINIRDYVAENSVLVRPLIKKLVKHSAMNAISSEGFKSFLPEGEYTRVNSINDEILTNCNVLPREGYTLPIKIGFAGNCRYFRESFRLIDALSNDSRFELWYCGTNSETLKEYAEEHGINNVVVKPAFNPDETLGIFSCFDIVNSAFGNDAMDNSTLMPIRLYTAVSMYLPILASEKTQLAKEVKDADIGFVISNYETLGNDLFDYMINLDKNDLKQKCDNYITEARRQNEVFYKKIDSLVEELS